MNRKELIKKITSTLVESFKNENTEMLTSQPEVQYDLEDQIGNFWIVKKAMKESNEDELVSETDVFGLAELINQGLTRESITGLYKSEGKARSSSKKIIRQRDTELKEDIKTASQQLKDLDGKIESIKTDIGGKTDYANNNPGVRDSISQDLDVLYKELTKFEELKVKLQSSLDKEKPKKEAPQEKPKEEIEDDK